MKQAYKTQKIGPEVLDIIYKAEQICKEYAAAGFSMTLRQVYYQFIARDLFPDTWIDVEYNRKNKLSLDTKNTEKNYKRLGDTLNTGRLCGLLDWDHMEDRTRNMKKIQTWGKPQDIIDAVRYGYRLDPWRDQENYVQVWIEKEALEGVIIPVCDQYRLPYIACKGYMSQSEMRAQAMSILRKNRLNKNVYILHLGDHDPSGIQMSEDIAGRMLMFGARLEFRRLALNMDQIEELNPPPNPAKVTDSRYAGYVEQFGIDESWELDALTPQYISNLISEQMTDLIDWDAWEATMRQEKEEKATFAGLGEHWERITELMGDHGLIPEVELSDDEEDNSDDE